MRRKLAIAALALAILAGGLLLFASPGSGPIGQAGARLQAAAGLGDPDYDLGKLRYFLAAAAKVSDEYVDPTRVHPDEMLSAALDQVAREIFDFLYVLDPERRTLELFVGETRKVIPLPSLDSLADLSGVVHDAAVFIDRNAGEEEDRPTIEYALMNGMLSTLDPHSVYIKPVLYEQMLIDNEGHFGGLGITIGIRKRRLTIIYPLPETPAARAGLKAGDHIDRIGNESTVNMELETAVGKLRGDVGTEVTITVSDDEGPDREITIVRALIDVPAVKWAYAGDGVGLVQILHFGEQTSNLLDKALGELETRAIEDRQGKLRGLVIDMRGNPGGYLQQAVEVADRFLEKGVIVATQGLGGSARDETQANGFATDEDLPLVVVVDAASASASEIVAGALQHHDRAVVLGIRTFGKGSVQNLYDRDFNKGALKLTIAQYLTGGDESIQGVGIVPDVELRPAMVERPDDGPPRVLLFWQDFEMREEDLTNAFQWEASGDADAQMRWVYACPECFEPRDTDKDPVAADFLDDPEVQAAKALILTQPSPRRSEMLKSARPTLDLLFEQRQRRLEDQLGELGAEWTAASPGARDEAQGEAIPLQVELSVDSPDGTLTPGHRTDVTLTVTNAGTRTLHRVRSVTEEGDPASEERAEGGFFEGAEFVFGRLEPGESRSFSVQATPPLWLHARTEKVTWHFFADEGTPPPFVGRLRIRDIPLPRFALSWQIVDDGSFGSRGNGDGLLQPGEEIDMVVAVQNTGTGPTSDLLDLPVIERPGYEADEGAPRESGFVSLEKNRSGAALFLTEGSGQFSLGPGEISEERLHFRVADDVAGVDEIEINLVAGDEEFLHLFASELKVPIYSPSDPVSAVQRRMKPRSTSAVVRGGAAEASEQVAIARGAIEIDGRLGPWLRTRLPWGTSGWVAATDLVAAARQDVLVPPERSMSHSPPQVSLSNSPGGSVVVSPRLRLDGSVRDDGPLDDLVVFVNDRKVDWKSLSRGAESPFQVEVDLEPGENQIEVFARDLQGHMGVLSIGVYRESATAAVQSGTADPVVQ